MLALLSAFAAAAAILGAPAGAAASSCVYDAGTKTANAVIDPGGSAALRVSGSDLTFAGVVCLGATTTNTDTITVAGNAGTNEVLTLDQRGGPFGPGFSSESNIVPEIEITTNLGDFADTVVVWGTEDADSISPGQLGLSLNADGDVDVTFSPSAFHMEIHALGGADYVNGFGQGGAGMHFLGPLVITGGDGDDVLLRGSTLDDVVRGGAGDDGLEGNDGVDSLDGGPGNDIITAAGGDDVLTGGPGTDTLNERQRERHDPRRRRRSRRDASTEAPASTPRTTTTASIRRRSRPRTASRWIRLRRLRRLRRRRGACTYDSASQDGQRADSRRRGGRAQGRRRRDLVRRADARPRAAARRPRTRTGSRSPAAQARSSS